MDKLKEIICNYVDVEPSAINGDMSLNNELGVDSFSLISMLVEIEDTYNCSIPDSALQSFQTLNDLYNYIAPAL